MLPKRKRRKRSGRRRKGNAMKERRRGKRVTSKKKRGYCGKALKMSNFSVKLVNRLLAMQVYRVTFTRELIHQALDFSIQ